VKRLLVVAATALAAVAIYAVTAPASEQSVTPKQFAALKATVTKQGKELKTLEACLFVGAAPVGVYGDGSTSGFLFQTSDKVVHLFPAISLVAQSQQAQATWVVTTTAQCAAAMNSKTGSPPRIARIEPAR
jgi:hypothetical protein